VGNNPVKRVDPNGMDWYRDDKGRLQYDPKTKDAGNYTFHVCEMIVLWLPAPIGLSALLIFYNCQHGTKAK